MNPSARPLVILLSLCLAAAAPLQAEEPPPAPSFEEVQAMIARMQQRLDDLGTATTERDQALRFLEQQVDQATGEIAGTGKTNEALRGETAVLSDQVDGLSRDRERLTGEAGERAAALSALESQVTALSGELGEAQKARSLLDRELADLRATLAKTAARESALAVKVAELEQGAREQTQSASAELAAALADAGQRGAEAEQLRGEAVAMRREIARLNELLAAAETRVDAQQDTIAGLDEELAQALARKVEELEQYRSEFFGRLKQALGDRPDLRVVGDRFVFQSELLFASGSARLDPAGQAQLRQLAITLEEVAARIPPGVDWILRVDGHTDRQPIRDGAFRSNWELSAARAISVIEFLTAQGIAPEHLAAAGFGEYRPIDTGDNEIAYRRNRRIEFKLTEG